MPDSVKNPHENKPLGGRYAELPQRPSWRLRYHRPMPSEPADRPPYPPLVLASTSRYRRELLGRLGVPFTVVAPVVDETAWADEVPRATALRLAEAKARAVGHLCPDALVIGSDQVADCDGIAVSKPGGRDEAVRQLTAQAGRSVVFHTAVAVLNTRTGEFDAAVVDVTSRFRTLTPAAIAAYVTADEPYDCAGSVRSEGLGITLFDALESDDPTALIGLPLIALGRLLRAQGVELPATG